MQGTVFDSFDVKGRVAVEYGATGVVAIVRGEGSVEAPTLNALFLVARPDGWMTRARGGDVKPSDDGSFGVFFPNLTKQDIPIGSFIRWGDRFWPDPDDLTVGAMRQPLAHV